MTFCTHSVSQTPSLQLQVERLRRGEEGHQGPRKASGKPPVQRMSTSEHCALPSTPPWCSSQAQT